MLPAKESPIKTQHRGKGITERRCLGRTPTLQFRPVLVSLFRTSDMSWIQGAKTLQTWHAQDTSVFAICFPKLGPRLLGGKNIFSWNSAPPPSPPPPRSAPQPTRCVSPETGLLSRAVLVWVQNVGRRDCDPQIVLCSQLFARHEWGRPVRPDGCMQTKLGRKRRW